jgi:HEAT repeats
MCKDALMHWILRLAVVIAWFAIAGCGGKSGAPADAGGSDPSSGSSSAAEAATPAPTAATTPTPIASAPAATSGPPASTAAPLRDLVGRYLVSDGQGGWRPDEKAATELEKLAPDDSQLVPLLRDSQADVRRGAVYALLGRFNPADAEQVDALTLLLGDTDRSIRGMALTLARQMRTEDQISRLPRLIAMLDPQREPDANHRAAVTRLAGGLKENGAAGLTSLVQSAAGDPDASVRSACLFAIWQIAKADESVVPLTKGLSDREASVRLVAAARLRQLGSASAPAAKELTVALGDSKSEVAEAAAEALIRIGRPAVEPLAGQLSSGNVSARKLALACLAKIGPPAKSAAAQIEKCKQDPDPQVRELAAAALKRVGGP